MDLRYGMNPRQAADATPVRPGRSPVRVVHGSPSYINMLDALNGWQLVREASRSLGRQAAASFKHVSPAGAAVAGPVDEVTAQLHGVDRTAVGALTSAYLRARDADPKSSYGDFAAVSHPVDEELAELLAQVVCDIVSDGALPFRDNIDHAQRHGVGHIAEPGGSIRSAEVEDACREHGIALVRTGLRLFHH